MRRFAEVQHTVWIAAPIETVRAQFADLHHHITANVHPKLRFEILSLKQGEVRYVQEVKLLGLKQRDVFVRKFTADGRMIDTSVEGFNKSGSLSFAFSAQREAGRDGTCVSIAVHLPLPPLIGGLIRPLLESQVRRELAATTAEDKHDIEVRGYSPRAPTPTLSP